MSEQSHPLAGVRVLDFSQNLPGPYATLVLASLGAEVIKIEPPRGDPARMTARLFEIVNAGKRSVVLDLKDPSSEQTLKRLVREVDVLVEGFRPGVMARFGLDAKQALQLNPRLVYCSISGYGQSGPYRDHPGHDLNFQALTGVCDMNADDRGRPRGSALPVADLSSAMTAVIGIVSGLLGRQQDGQGRVVDVAMVDTVMSWAHAWAEGLTPSDAKLSRLLGPLARSMESAAGAAPGPVASALTAAARRLGRETVRRRADEIGAWIKGTDVYRRLVRKRLYALPHYALYRARDGRWLSVGIVDEHKFWRALCEGLGLPAVSGLPLGARIVAAAPLRRLFALAFARRSSQAWLEILDRHRVPVTLVKTVSEALDDEHLSGRRVARSGLALHGPFPLSRPLHSAPELGADTEHVVSGLGL